MIKDSIYEDDITMLNTHVCNSGNSCEIQID